VEDRPKIILVEVVKKYILIKVTEHDFGEDIMVEKNTWANLD